MTVTEKSKQRTVYVNLSFVTLIAMVIATILMPFLGIKGAEISATVVGFIGLGASFAGIVAVHLGTTPKDTKNDTTR